MPIQYQNNAFVGDSQLLVFAPAQAYVLASEIAIQVLGSVTPDAFALTDKGLTWVDGITMGNWFNAAATALGNTTIWFSFAGNDLTQAAVDSILAGIGSVWAGHDPVTATLTLTGGTNATPSAQGLIDKAALVANGWTVTNN